LLAPRAFIWLVQLSILPQIELTLNLVQIQCVIVMLNLARDINSLSNFKRDTSRFIEQMKETGNPVVLTVNGKAELIVQDTESYQKLLERLDRLEAIAGIQQGLADIKAGRTQELGDFAQKMQSKYEISG
jgi:PHD/YefM family antitoxin component YafN of YafNO toxin-antitoxin module